MTGLRSGQVAEAAGVNLQTLRYYERRGLLAEPDRTLGGHRQYPAETVTVLRVIKAAQRLGFSLQEVADLIDVGTHRHGRRRPDGLQSRARQKLAEVDARIADLTIIRETLHAALAAGCDDLIPAPPPRSVRCRSPTWPTTPSPADPSTTTPMPDGVRLSRARRVRTLVACLATVIVVAAVVAAVIVLRGNGFPANSEPGVAKGTAFPDVTVADADGVTISTLIADRQADPGLVRRLILSRR